MRFKAGLDPRRDVVEHHRTFGLVEHLVVQLRVDLQVHISGTHTFDQVLAALHRDQLVLLTVHDEQRRGQRTGALGHGLADAEQRAGDTGGQLAVVHHRVGVVRGDHIGVTGYRVGG